MQTVTIHKATASDAGELLALQAELAAHEGEPSAATEAALAAMLAGEAAPACHCLLARAEKEIPRRANALTRDDVIPNDVIASEESHLMQAPIGFILYYPGYDLSSATYGFHLGDIYVREGWRGQGVGKRLLGELARHAKDESREWCSLTVLTHNKPAQSFYAAQGFRAQKVKFFATGKKGILRLVNLC